MLIGDGLVVKLCPTPVTPWTAACQAPLSMGFPKQEYWRGLPFPSPGDLPPQGSNLCLWHHLHWQARLFTTKPPGKPASVHRVQYNSFFLSISLDTGPVFWR